MKNRRVISRMYIKGKRHTPFYKRLSNTRYRYIHYYGTDAEYKKAVGYK